MENDYAVIIGLQHYPGLDDPNNGRAALSGPENDAKDFKEWIASSEGGNVPEQNISLLLSSRYTPVTLDDLPNAKPAETDIKGAFEKLVFLSKQKSELDLGGTVGRRLYIFMSGHGIAPTQFGNKMEKECSLLMANVNSLNIISKNYNIPGLYTATWFCENDYFEEIFLFMDCCRDMTLVTEPNWYLPQTGNEDKAKRFYAFATKWSRRSREQIIEGKMQGIFTKTLLMALKGGCVVPDPAQPGQGVITGDSLKNYLFDNMKNFIDPAAEDDNQQQQPDIDYFPKENNGRDIIIKQAPLVKFPIIINIPANASGYFRILNNDFNVVAQGVMTAATPQFKIDLPRGRYLLDATADSKTTSRVINVLGIEQAGKEGVFWL